MHREEGRRVHVLESITRSTPVGLWIGAPRLPPLSTRAPSLSWFRLSAFRPSAFGANLLNRRSSCDDRNFRQPNEQPMLNHSGRATQLPRQRRRIRDLPKAAIENLVAIVGHEGTAI